MPYEKVKIIIRKNGEIWIDLGELEPQRIRHYKQLFEEVLGPIKGEIATRDGGWGSEGVPLTEQVKSGEEEEQKEKI